MILLNAAGDAETDAAAVDIARGCWQLHVLAPMTPEGMYMYLPDPNWAGLAVGVHAEVRVDTRTGRVTQLLAVNIRIVGNKLDAYAV